MLPELAVRSEPVSSERRFANVKVISVRLSGFNALRARPELYAAFCRNLLESLIGANRETLKIRSDIPPLYQSGVRYRNEPVGYEWFDDILICLNRGWGDCDDLVAWRVAELREQGELAEVYMRWEPGRKNPGTRLFHVIVKRGNGELEDPSALLGMPT